MKFNLKYLQLLVLACSFAFGASAQKPNIIFILADDLGYADVGCYGQEKINTPNIDALAAGGMKFTQFYSGSTVCAPARASFLTGLHTGHSPIRGNVPDPKSPEGQFPMPAENITIAMELKKAGYNTGAFGKWSMGFLSTTGAPSKKGFDEFFGYNCQSLAHNYYPDHLWHNEESIMLNDGGKSNITYSPDLVQEEALKFINRQDIGKPFFLYLPYTLPHADLTPPHDSLYTFYKNKFREKPIAQTSKNNLNKNAVELYPHAAYAAMVARLDHYVGQVCAAVKAAGMLENTVIIFTSDNGPHQEKGGDPAFFNSGGIYRGIKRDLYEGGIREPMIVSWSNHIHPGTVSDYVGAFWDLFPTFQQLAGVPVSKNIDGRSFLPVLLGKKQKDDPFLYWELHESGGRQAIRWKNWKAVKLDLSTGHPQPTELYNLNTDPSEQNNVAAQNPSLVKKLEKMMDKAHVKNSAWPLFASEK